MQPLCDHYLRTSEAVLKRYFLFQRHRRKSRPPLPPSRKSFRTEFPVLPGFGTLPLSAMLQKTKNMMQNYYQIPTPSPGFDLLLGENGIPCILLRASASPPAIRCPEVLPETRDLDLYINRPKASEKKPRPSWKPRAIKEEKRTHFDHHVTYRYTFQDRPASC